MWYALTRWGVALTEGFVHCGIQSSALDSGPSLGQYDETPCPRGYTGYSGYYTGYSGYYTGYSGYYTGY